MTMREYLEGMGEEKSFRASIYVSSQARRASKVEEAVSIWELLNNEDNIDYMIIFKPNKEDFSFANSDNPHCDSIFIDGDYGYWSEDEVYFLKISDYGKTWAAAKWADVTAEYGWPLAQRIANKLQIIKEYE